MNNSTTKTKLVVFKEHTLGYIIPEIPNYVNILSSSVLRGAPLNLGESPFFILDHKKDYRLANDEDFNIYRTCSDGYANDPMYLSNLKNQK